ncbi:MAG: phosphatidylserine decarboxylase family protein [Rhodospirillaceae bacterium]|nr:phosphatidylserine decarboxylase family protein [Rhodospirillaceae bacterium]OUT78970.1 MAG: phosphatidylserine decarboxylase [Rhodospirillaceae bacterium TMED23]
MLKPILTPINRAGWPFIAIFIIITIILAYISETLGWIGIVLTAWCMYFFRDPSRVTPNRDGLVVSPADGTIQIIEEAQPPPELEMGGETYTKIAIFMNVFNVHVNRIPLSGTIKKLVYHPGKFFNASLDKASILNERQSVQIDFGKTRSLVLVQIAGLIARRIKCELNEEQQVITGERFGLIRFGSRVDLYIPKKIPIFVSVGQSTIAGETIIADLKSREKNRDGTMR